MRPGPPPAAQDPPEPPSGVTLPGTGTPDIADVAVQPGEPERPPASARSMVRNTVVAWAGEVAAKTASLIFFAVMARRLGEDGFGAFVFAASLSVVLLLMAGVGTDKLLERELSRDLAGARAFVAAVTRLKATTALLVLTPAALTMIAVGRPREVWLTFCLVGLGTACEEFSKTRYAAFVAFERMRYMSIAVVIQRLATSVTGVTLLVLGGGLITVSLVFLGGALLGLAVAERSFRRLTRASGRVSQRSVSWRWLIREGVAIGVLSMLFVVLLQFDIVLLGLLTGTGEVGFFGAAHRTVEATMFLVWYVGSAVMPWVARADDGDSAHLARGYELGLKAMTALLVPVAVVFTVLAGPLVALLYGEDFGPAVLPLQLLSAMTVLYGINYMTTTFFIGRGRAGAFGWLVAGVVVQNVAFNVVLIPLYGAAGAAFNAVLSAVLMAGLGIWRARTVVGPVRPVRPFVTPLVAGVAMALAMASTAHLPLVSIAVGGVVYLASLALVERVLFPVEFGEWQRVIAGAIRPA